MPKPLSLRGRDGGQRELGAGTAASGSLHLDLHEAERTMERRRLEVDAADAIERDHAGRVAETPRSITKATGRYRSGM